MNDIYDTETHSDNNLYLLKSYLVTTNRDNGLHTVREDNCIDGAESRVLLNIMADAKMGFTLCTRLGNETQS